ncbi:MAG: hypothetical protein WKF82_11560 [Nocardioidaceae bacterium]
MTHLHANVSALVDGELSPRARCRALAHARRCSTCEGEIAATLELKQRLLGLPAAEPRAQLFSSLGLVMPERGDERPTGRAGPAAQRLVLAAGSMSMAFLIIAYAVGAPQEPAAPLVTPPIDDYTAEFARETSQSPLADPGLGASAEWNLTADVTAILPGQAFLRGEVSPPGQVSLPFQTSLPGQVPLLTPPFSATIGMGSADPVSSQSGVGSADDAAQVDSDDQQAVALLRRANTAPSALAYDGIQVTDVATEVGGEPAAQSLVLRVEHAPGQGTSFRSVEPPAAQLRPATFVDAADVLNEAQTAGDRPAAQALRQLVATFDVALVGPAEVSGRAATLIEARAAGQLAARFYMDDVSGLLLQRDVYDEGQLARSTRFLSVHIRRQGFLSHLPPRIEGPSSTVLSTELAAALDDEGWTCPDTLASGARLTRLHRLEGAGDVVQATYTDGLSNIAIFEQRGELSPVAVRTLEADFELESSGDNDLYVRSAMPTVAVWQSGETVFTVVTDAVPTVAQRVIAELPHEPPASTSEGTRLGDGLSRLLTSLDPAS